MTEFQGMSDEDRWRMGQMSREIIAGWGLDRFASGLQKASAIAVAGVAERRRVSPAGMLLLRGLCRL